VSLSWQELTWKELQWEELQWEELTCDDWPSAILALLCSANAFAGNLKTEPSDGRTVADLLGHLMRDRLELVVALANHQLHRDVELLEPLPQRGQGPGAQAAQRRRQPGGRVPQPVLVRVRTGRRGVIGRGAEMGSGVSSC